MDPLDKTDADLIVLAGDIHKGTKGIDYAVSLAESRVVPVIYVAGNHEYYGQEYFHTLQAMRYEAAKHENVHFLENGALVVGNTRFLGCTLWTNFTGDGSIRVERNVYVARGGLMDFKLIRYNERKMTPEDHIRIHASSKKWLNEQLDMPFEGKTVVVTHHGPSRATQHAVFEFNEVSACFLTAMDDLVEKADLWIYGHSHSNLDTQIGKCRLVSNQKGYPRERVPRHQAFDPGWVLDI